VYLARELGTALSEVYGDVPSRIDICRNARAAVMAPLDATVLADLRSTGLMAIGAYPALASSSVARRRSQEWARAIYDDRPEVMGIAYRGAHDNGDCLVLWDRAPALTLVTRGARTLDLALHDAVLWPTVVARLAERGRLARIVKECPRCR